MHRVLEAAAILAGVGLASGANFTVGEGPAALFGTHEIVLTAAQVAPNPFAVEAEVTLVPPSGPAQAIRVDAFHDGASTWRARVYVTEVGVWRWTSRCAADAGLDGRSGRFTAVGSKLHGMLRRHRANPRAWMTDDGQWFLNLSDTAYRLMHSQAAPDWQQYVVDDVALGITCLRSAALGGWGGTPGAKTDSGDYWAWNDPWPGGVSPDHQRFDLGKFQTTDQRLTWLLDRYPDLQVQLILFGLKGYGNEGTGQWWAALPADVRERTMRYMLARWAAFPNVFWLIVNDMSCDAGHPLNQAFAREVGAYFAAHDPWHHLLSAGPVRRAGFPFTSPADRQWCSYVHIEDANAVGADAIAERGLRDVPLHIWMAEDYYEQDHGHYADARYFFRWLLWSWLLSGGSGNYGGRWGTTHPYSQTGRPDLVWVGWEGTYTGLQLTGLDSVPYIRAYFADRAIDLGLFVPDDQLAADLDGRAGKHRPKVMRRANAEYVVYHPNAAGDGREARVDAKPARLSLDLKASPGRFAVEWYRALDGRAQVGDAVTGGAMREFTAPWPGQDVVLRLLRGGD
ncbi:MAG: DUF5060 domain-containing protein [Armatimonadetes bacterium]|nr:DUF5060 domain-containing protein [Armatimonadota bacterium]